MLAEVPLITPSHLDTIEKAHLFSKINVWICIYRFIFLFLFIKMNVG